MSSGGTDYTVRPTLVLGWGNEWRGDDAVGRVAARAIAAECRTQVEVADVHQLTPEWACTIAAHGRVIFLDALRQATEVQVSRLTASPTDNAHTAHRVAPDYLLALAATCYNAHPVAWLIGIPVQDFTMGAPLSSVAQRGVAVAVAACRRLLPDVVAPPIVPEFASDESPLLPQSTFAERSA